MVVIAHDSVKAYDGGTINSPTCREVCSSLTTIPSKTKFYTISLYRIIKREGMKPITLNSLITYMQRTLPQTF